MGACLPALEKKGFVSARREIKDCGARVFVCWVKTLIEDVIMGPWRVTGQVVKNFNLFPFSWLRPPANVQLSNRLCSLASKTGERYLS